MIFFPQQFFISVFRKAAKSQHKNDVSSLFLLIHVDINTSDTSPQDQKTVSF